VIDLFFFSSFFSLRSSLQIPQETVSFNETFKKRKKVLRLKIQREKLLSVAGLDLFSAMFIVCDAEVPDT